MTVLELEDSTQVNVIRAERDNDFRKRQMGRIFVQRSSLDLSSVETGVTEAWLLLSSGDSRSNAEMGGVIKDVNRQGSTTEIMLESFEKLAVDAIPTGGAETWGPAGDDENGGVPDSDIIQDAIDKIPDVTAGTVETLADPISIVFNHATQAKKIREVANITGAAVQYNPDKTVDYVDRLGQDRTEVLSPGNQNIRGDFSADRRTGGEQNITHLRVIGAGEGSSQIKKNIVPEDDSNSYDDEVRYTNADFNSGDDPRWFVKSNKDIDRSNAAEEYGLTLINDITDQEYIDVSTTIEGIDNVYLGDVFHVEYNEENVDHDMQVVELTAKYDEGRIRYEVTMSTRRESREDKESEDLKDIERFNQASQGVAVPINAGGGRQPVDPNNNYQMKLYYPDEVISEIRLNVRVMGLPYRAYSQGAGAGAGEIGNEIPFDVSTAKGSDGVLTERMKYPAVGGQNVSEDPLLYDEGTGADRFDSNTVADSGSISTMTFSENTDHLFIESQTDVPGSESAETDGNWAQTDRLDLSSYSTLEVEFDVSFAGGGVTEQIHYGVGGTDRDKQGEAWAADKIISSGTGGRVTNSLDISSVSGREKVRLYAYTTNESSQGSSAVATAEIYRVELIE